MLPSLHTVRAGRAACQRFEKIDTETISPSLKLKLNGRFRTRSPLSDVVELETLVVGITGKQALWLSLRSATVLPADELDDLVDRAERQKRIVEGARKAAARRAFAVHDPPG